MSCKQAKKDRQPVVDAHSHILLLEDDPAQRLLLAAYLRTAGCRVQEAESLAQGRAFMEEGAPSLALVDLNLPDGDGLELARNMIRRGIPVIIVTSRMQDRIPALELGADDYLDKPYQPRELLARVQNVLRRCGQRASRTLQIGTFQLDLERRQVRNADGGEIGLTRGEFDLLAALALAQGRVSSRAVLAELVSPEGNGAGGRSVDVLVSRLRHKLEEDPGNPSLVLTAPGYGYRLRL